MPFQSLFDFLSFDLIPEIGTETFFTQARLATETDGGVPGHVGVHVSEEAHGQV